MCPGEAQRLSRSFIEVLQKPANELLMSISEDYRQIQEERELIDRSLPALFPGKVRAPLPLHPDCFALAKAQALLL